MARLLIPEAWVSRDLIEASASVSVPMAATAVAVLSG